MSDIENRLLDQITSDGGDAVPGWLAALREQGSERFRNQGLPTTRVEEWKYTSLRALEQRVLADENGAGVKAVAPQPLAELPVCISMIDGDMVGSDGEIPPGARIMPLRQALANVEPGMQTVLEALETGQLGQGLSALNTAALNSGVVIHVDKDVQAGDMLLQWSGSESAGESLFNARVLILLEAGASLNLVEQFENAADESAMLNVVVQCSLAENAELTHTRLQQQSASSVLVTRGEITQAANSRLQFTGLDLGEGLARHDVHTALAGEGASCALNGACITRNSSHVDHHLEADHIAGNCQSSQLFRAVAGDRSRVVFNGKVHVRKGADGTEASQSSKGLLLSKLAEIDAKPELEIYADEVIASHGATTGQLDDEALFYMQSRGLDRNEAKNLLTMAFCRVVTDQLPVAALREPLGERLSRSLILQGAEHV